MTDNELDLRGQIKFCHEELLRWRKDYDRLQRRCNSFEKIVELCKEEIDHGFDLPSEIFDAVESLYDKGILR